MNMRPLTNASCVEMTQTTSLPMRISHVKDRLIALQV